MSHRAKSWQWVHKEKLPNYAGRASSPSEKSATTPPKDRWFCTFWNIFYLLIFTAKLSKVAGNSPNQAMCCRRNGPCSEFVQKPRPCGGTVHRGRAEGLEHSSGCGLADGVAMLGHGFRSYIKWPAGGQVYCWLYDDLWWLMWPSNGWSMGFGIEFTTWLIYLINYYNWQLCWYKWEYFISYFWLGISDWQWFCLSSAKFKRKMWNHTRKWRKNLVKNLLWYVHLQRWAAAKSMKNRSVGNYRDRATANFKNTF